MVVKRTSINCFFCVGFAFIPHARQFVQAPLHSLNRNVALNFEILI